MKHRGTSQSGERSRSKLKYEHHMIPGLREVLEKIAEWEEVISIIPARICHRKSSGAFVFNVQYDTPDGIKCLAKSGGAIQEVFIVSAHRGLLREKLFSLSTA